MPSSSATAQQMPARQDAWIPFGKAEMSAWVYPSPVSTKEKPGPAVVLGHGLGAVKDMRLDAYSEVFQRAGYTCVAFDYRGFGQSKGSEPQILNFEMQQQDWAVVLKWVRELDYVDPERLAIFGTSFGGAHAIVAASKDHRLKAAIAQCPFTSGPHSALTVGWRVIPWLSIVGLRDWLFGKENDRVPVKLAGKPGAVALMNAPDVEPGYLSLAPPRLRETTPITVAGSVALEIPFLIPGRYAKHVQCPIYFAVCKNDSVAPAGPTRAYAKQAPKGVIKDYDYGHFDIYINEAFDVASADYVEFLKKNVPI